MVAETTIKTNYSQQLSLERGNALVGFAPFLIIMIIFFLFIADVGQYVYYRLCLDNAAYTASRSLASNITTSNEQLINIALSTSPALSGGELSISSAVSPVQKSVYVHHLPIDDAHNTFRERVSNAAYQAVRVTVQFSYAATTPFCMLLARNNQDNHIVLVASYGHIADALIDANLESSTW